MGNTAIGKAFRSSSERLLQPPAVWQDRPTLGDVPGQKYLGRVVIELVDEEARVAFVGVEDTLARRAAEELQHLSLPPQPETEPWPAEPIMGRGSPEQAFAGRVTVELWANSARVAVSAFGLVDRSELVRRAALGLRNLRPVGL